jgi:hypothetical protein
MRFNLRTSAAFAVNGNNILVQLAKQTCNGLGAINKKRG